VQNHLYASSANQPTAINHAYWYKIPRPAVAALAEALHAEHADARANAARALGKLKMPADTVVPLLIDKDPRVLQEVLLALADMPGAVGGNVILPLLTHENADVRGAAALSLAYKQPETALKVIPPQLQCEIKAEHLIYEEHVNSGKPQEFPPAQAAAITASFRCQMRMVQAISSLKGARAMQALEDLAFTPHGLFPDERVCCRI
jgi:HEAT repeat protein